MWVGVSAQKKRQNLDRRLSEVLFFLFGLCLNTVLWKVWRASKWILNAVTSLLYLWLCVFIVGKFIWVSVRVVVKHGHNGPTLLWHVQQWAFLCVCHTLRKMHTNKHCDNQTAHLFFLYQHYLMLCYIHARTFVIRKSQWLRRILMSVCRLEKYRVYHFHICQTFFTVHSRRGTWLAITNRPMMVSISVFDIICLWA